MKNAFFLFFTLSLVSSAWADVSQVDATIDKNPVMLDEAIQLTVISEGDPNRDAFDSSALLKDFVVGRTSVSTQTSIVNFDKRQTTTWTTTLFPRKTGRFTIPAFRIENQQSAPIQVEVIPVQDGANKPARDYYVTTEVDTDSVYLHQQIRYTTKLYLATGIERGSLQAPELTNAQVKQIGDDKQYSEIINGKRYQIIERSFAIIPQHSGEFTVRGPVFAGEVLAPNTNQRFGFFNRTQSVNRVGPDIDIEVKPVPANIGYHWLPSEFVRLDEEWQQDKEFVVGEPVTRTLTLTAMGVVEEQLPDLPQSYPPNFKLYPDQSNTATINRDGTLIAQRVESVALIPTQAGRFVLPELQVPWFNVLTGETEYARLPARSIEVKAATSATRAPAQPLPENTFQSSVEQNTAAPQPQPSVPAEISVPSRDYAWWALAALWLATLAGWGGTVYYYRNARARPAKTSIRVAPGIEAEKQAFNTLLDALKSGKTGSIQAALKHWLTALDCPKGQLIRPADWEVTRPLQVPVDEMLQYQYGNHAGQWQPELLVSTLKQVRQTYLQQRKTSADSLPALYPS
ncbi:BatD family protein [Alteromonas aestuariivivens]|nr:BatD family protein [Alteromonas aestuariivivens]